ncbi:MAG: hypothetical protein MUC60_13665 [Oscillatoria sp. Prado101]|nr:hypothetical protein [Oscillatoria sp. Prado101]
MSSYFFYLFDSDTGLYSTLVKYQAGTRAAGSGTGDKCLPGEWGVRAYQI